MNKKEIDSIKSKIKNLVNQTDPWHLLEGGAPDDEYNVYIDHIVSFVVNKKPDVNTLSSKLLNIFKTNEFELNREKLRDLAAGIIESI